MGSDALIIFIKNPVLGIAKTRIAAEVGDQEALNIYLKLLQYTRSMTARWKGDKYLYYSSEINHHDEWSASVFKKRIQIKGGLGEKMSDAFRDLSTQYDRVAIIGSDCYQLETSHIETAFRSLEKNDVVIGPSLDGGYYLLGMSNFYPSLFTQITWSTNQVTSQTIDKLESQKLRYQLIDPLRDVDHYQDWLDQNKS